jgi:hypothetical protein
MIRTALLTAAMLAACAFPHVLAAESRDAQVEQLKGIESRPGETIEDSLFILWEYGGALREVELAKIVLAKSRDTEIQALARLVRDGHRAGMEAMRAPAAELSLALPTEPTPAEMAAIGAAAAMPTERLEAFFLRRQRAMHAWDVTVFDDYSLAAVNPRLRAYVEATRAPLREHAAIVDRLARARGISR